MPGMSSNKERMTAQIRALQRQLDELAGMVLALPSANVEEKRPAPEQPKEGQPEREIMSARQVQEYLGIGESTFYAWIREGRLPQGELWGKKMRRWRRSELLPRQ